MPLSSQNNFGCSMGCLNVCGRGALIHLCLVSISLKCIYSNIFKSNSYKFFIYYVLGEKVQGIWLWSWKHKTSRWDIVSIFLQMFSYGPFVRLDKWFGSDLINDEM